MNMGNERTITPYLYSPVARVVYNRILQERAYESIDRNEWYRINLEQIPSEEIRLKFIQLGWDDETEEFVNQSSEKSSWLSTQIWHAVITFFVSWTVSKTSLNGWLNRGSMFVLSEKQFLKLTGWSEDHKSEALLDLGAGDGKVSAKYAKFFEKTFVTEVSPVMRKLLIRQGHEIKEVETWASPDDPIKYSLIAALNLLDRCDKPMTILKQIPTKLATNGLVLLGIVLPIKQYVETNPPTFQPSETIGVRGKTMEDQVYSFVECVLEPLGYKLKSWSRVPYLCEGDLNNPYYWLFDIVLLLEHSLTSTSDDEDDNSR